MTLALEIIEAGGQKRLYFPFISISDIHWGTKYSRSKRLCQLFENTQSDILEINGDGIDGEILLQKKKWHFPAWHRQGIAHLIRKAAQGTKVFYHPGNHEKGMRGEEYDVHGEKRIYPSAIGQTIYGVDIVEERVHEDPQGRRFLILHGDKYDAAVFKTAESQERWYRIGSILNDTIYSAESFIRSVPVLEHFSIASLCKRLVKTYINGKLQVRAVMAGAIDATAYDGAIYGHSHMGGFQKTSGGKMLMNDGCCTDHVQALVHDREGNWALVEWHADRLDIEEENGAKQTVLWRDLGLQDFGRPPTEFKDESVRKAGAVVRIIHKMWPPRKKAPKAKPADLPDYGDEMVFVPT